MEISQKDTVIQMTKNLDPGGGQEVEGQGHPHLQAGFETQELSSRLLVPSEAADLIVGLVSEGAVLSA